MPLPTGVIERGGRGTECGGELRRREIRERAMAVVVIPGRLQLSLQIDRVPEGDAVQVLTPAVEAKQRVVIGDDIFRRGGRPC
jgi:hypothetical protein